MRDYSRNSVVCILTLAFCVTAHAQSPAELTDRVVQLERNQQELMAALVEATRVLEKHRAFQTQTDDFQRTQQAASARVDASIADVLARLKMLEASRKARLPAQRPIASPSYNIDQLGSLTARVTKLEGRIAQLQTTTGRTASIDEYATAMVRRELTRAQSAIDASRRRGIIVTDPRYDAMASRFWRLAANRQNDSPFRSSRHSTPNEMEGGFIEPCCGSD